MTVAMAVIAVVRLLAIASASKRCSRPITRADKALTEAGYDLDGIHDLTKKLKKHFTTGLFTLMTLAFALTTYFLCKTAHG